MTTLLPLSGPPGVMAVPDVACGTGVLVLSGSSGRIEQERCRVLADAGALAVSVQWFGAAGQPPGICEVPLEEFQAPLGILRSECDRIAVLGTSKGAEAALLLGAHDHTLASIIAIAPTPWVWANVGAGRDGKDRPQRSSFSLDGVPLPFVPYIDWEWRGEGKPRLREFYERCVDAHALLLERAAIPVERIRGDVILAAGGDDQMWDSLRHARVIEKRRDRHGLATTVVSDVEAGHRLVLPEESVPPPSTSWDHGGRVEADARLGAALWAELVKTLELNPAPDRTQ